MHSKVFSRFATGIMASVVVASLGIGVAKANNCSDSYFTFSFEESAGRYEDNTTGRYKSDDTCGYIYGIDVPDSYRVALVGAGGEGSGEIYEDMYPYELRWYNMVEGQDMYLVNYLKESIYHYDYAAIKGESSNWGGFFTSYFKWSPDSV